MAKTTDVGAMFDGMIHKKVKDELARTFSSIANFLNDRLTEEAENLIQEPELTSIPKRRRRRTRKSMQAATSICPKCNKSLTSTGKHWRGASCEPKE